MATFRADAIAPSQTADDCLTLLLITYFINSNCDGKKPGVTPASRNRQISEARLIRKGIRDFWIVRRFSALVTYLRGSERRLSVLRPSATVWTYLVCPLLCVWTQAPAIFGFRSGHHTQFRSLPILKGMRPWAKLWKAGNAPARITLPVRHNGVAYRGARVKLSPHSCSQWLFTRPDRAMLGLAHPRWASQSRFGDRAFVRRAPPRCNCRGSRPWITHAVIEIRPALIEPSLAPAAA